MRILVLSDLPQFVAGGAETQAARLICSWLGAGHEVRCLGRRMSGTQITLDGHCISVARIRTIDRAGRLLRAVSFFFSLSRHLLRHRSWADVVYCRFLGESAATVALLKKLRLLSMPLVATPANVHGKGDAVHLKSVPGWRWIVQLLDRHADAINLIAADMDPELRAIGFGGRNFQHIPNGVPVGDLAQRVSPKRRWVFIGRLTDQKGIDVLIEALSAIPVESDAPEILIVGDGPERERLMTMARTSPWEHRIRFIGGVAPTQVRDHLSMAELFLLPSRYEGMSNAALEAMERGIPVLLSRCGGLDRYITSSCGWVVAPNDAQSLRHALLEALGASSDRLSLMGRACRKLVEERFDISAIAADYLDLFARLPGRASHAD